MIETSNSGEPRLFIRPTPTKLSQFIQSELGKYLPEVNTHFGFALGRVERYERFLRMILDRYRPLNTRLGDIAGAMARIRRERMAEHPNGGVSAFSHEEAALLSEQLQLTDPLHLESESFYVFAKIFLDSAAQFLGHYFAPGTEDGRRAIRGLSLISHDQLCKHFERYATALKIEHPPGVIDQMKDLRTRIVYVRDYDIAHERDPYAFTGTTWGKDGSPTLLRGAVTLAGQTAKIPRSADTPEALMSALEAYIETYTDIIARNRDKSRFMRPLAAVRGVG